MNENYLRVIGIGIVVPPGKRANKEKQQKLHKQLFLSNNEGEEGVSGVTQGHFPCKGRRGGVERQREGRRERGPRKHVARDGKQLSDMLTASLRTSKVTGGTKASGQGCQRDLSPTHIPSPNIKF